MGGSRKADMQTVEHRSRDAKSRLPAALLDVLEEQTNYDPVPNYPRYLWAKWFVSIIEDYGVCHDEEERQLLVEIYDRALTGAIRYTAQQ